MKDMQEIILLRGLPGSGKSTLANSMVAENRTRFKRINRDSLRLMLDNGVFDSENEKFVKKMRDVLVLEALKEGYSVIVDDLNLSPKHQRRMQDIANLLRKKHQLDIETRTIEMNTPLEICIERDAKREKPVGASKITQLYEQFYGNAKKKDRGPHYREQSEHLPKAIICDLDGTLAIINHRNPYDASNCEKDGLNHPVSDVLFTYKERGVHVILLSGRLDTYKSQTIKWLENHNIPYDALVMRAENDARKDSIVKKEFFEHYIQDKYNVLFVLDDRNQVVDLWRKELGLACFQVNYGDF